MNPKKNMQNNKDNANENGNNYNNNEDNNNNRVTSLHLIPTAEVQSIQTSICIPADARLPNNTQSVMQPGYITRALQKHFHRSWEFFVVCGWDGIVPGDIGLTR